MDPEAVLDGLDADQRVAVTTPAAPLCILAGAGSGKTRVLTRRVAYRLATGKADPRHVLVLTFTRKAAGELSSRLAALGARDVVAAGTFHAIAYAQLRNRWAEAGTAPPSLLDRKVRLLAPLLDGRTGPAVAAADVAAEIEWAKARMVSPTQYAGAAASAGRRPPIPTVSIAALYERYEEEKHRRRLVDFEDLLLLCVSALENDTAFAAAQRWRFRHLFVDELQDVNPLQHRLMEAWRGDRDDLCVVGDAEQAIYSWNGADAGFLTGFLDRHPGADVVQLTRNYRSTPQILGVANRVLSCGRTDGPAVQHATRPDGPTPLVESFATDLDEARGIARRVRDAHAPGMAWSHIAVLARTHAQTALLVEALRAADVPFRVRGGSRFLHQPEIRAALRDLQQSATSFDGSVADLASAVAESREQDHGDSERVVNLDALLGLASDYASLDPAPTADGFLLWLLATVRGDEPDRRGDAVDVATFHAAKGLEWHVVFVAGLEQGLVPIAHATTPDAVAEERRLLYVALTRAQHALHCSWAARRTIGDRVVERHPSEWLAAIDDGARDLDTADAVVDWKARLARERQRLAAVRPPGGGPSRPRGSRRPAAARDRGVLDALKAWRSATARAAGVSAFAVFHDRTLEALAESRPSSREALLAVPGIGPVKAARYGEALLDVVARHAC